MTTSLQNQDKAEQYALIRGQRGEFSDEQQILQVEAIFKEAIHRSYDWQSLHQEQHLQDVLRLLIRNHREHFLKQMPDFNTASACWLNLLFCQMLNTPYTTTQTCFLYPLLHKEKMQAGTLDEHMNYIEKINSLSQQHLKIMEDTHWQKPWSELTTEIHLISADIPLEWISLTEDHMIFCQRQRQLLSPSKKPTDAKKETHYLHKSHPKYKTLETTLRTKSNQITSLLKRLQPMIDNNFQASEWNNQQVLMNFYQDIQLFVKKIHSSGLFNEPSFQLSIPTEEKSIYQLTMIQNLLIALGNKYWDPISGLELSNLKSDEKNKAIKCLEFIKEIFERFDIKPRAHPFEKH